MLTYQQLGFVADCYTPILLLANLLLPALRYTQHPRQSVIWWAETLWGLLVAYGLMLADQYGNWWPQWELDYSTHTAVALILVMNLCRYHRPWPWGLSLLCYGALMDYQDYHSWADMLTTAVVVSSIFAAGLQLRRYQLMSPSP